MLGFGADKAANSLLRMRSRNCFALRRSGLEPWCGFGVVDLESDGHQGARDCPAFFRI